MIRYLVQHLYRLSRDLADGAEVEWLRAFPIARWPPAAGPAYARTFNIENRPRIVYVDTTLEKAPCPTP